MKVEKDDFSADSIFKRIRKINRDTTLNKEQKMFARLREILKFGKCKKCQKGDFSCVSDVRKKNSKAYIQNVKTGKIKYYCNAGCILLQLDDDGIKQAYHGFVVGGLKQ